MTIFNVNDQTSFFNAMRDMVLDRANSHTLNITGSFIMSAPVAPVVLDDGQTLTINGGGFTIDGGGAFRPFFISSSSPTTAGGPIVTISNLTIANGMAEGGDGGGGGMGAGGGLFVDQNATVILDLVNFTGNGAVGGDGSSVSRSGGGGLGGDGGDNGGGGGGLYGTGGSGQASKPAVAAEGRSVAAAATRDPAAAVVAAAAAFSSLAGPLAATAAAKAVA